MAGPAARLDISRLDLRSRGWRPATGQCPSPASTGT